MTKEQTIELLQKQLPGFYSVEQVINIIKDIEESASSVSEAALEELLREVDNAIEEVIGRVDQEDIVELSTAEFELHNGNEIELSSVALHVDELVRITQREVRKVIRQTI
jgi:hypothetical protein